MLSMLRPATRLGLFLLFVVSFVLVVPAAPAHEPGPVVFRCASAELRSGVEHRDGEKLSERSRSSTSQQRRAGRRVGAFDAAIPRRVNRCGGTVLAAAPATNHSARGDRFSRPDSQWARRAHAPAALRVYRH